MEFNHRTVLRKLADVIQGIIGDRLPLLKGSLTDRAIYLNYTDGVKSKLPFITLEFIPTNDQDGYAIDNGIVEVTIPDPDNVGSTLNVFAPYTDTLVYFSVDIRCESDPTMSDVRPDPETPSEYERTNSAQILRDIRKNLMLPRNRALLKEVNTVVQFGNNPIRSTPDLLSNDYHEVHTLTLRMSSVDRVIDYDTLSFDNISWTTEIYRAPEDPDPIILTGNIPHV